MQVIVEEGSNALSLGRTCGATLDSAYHDFVPPLDDEDEDDAELNKEAHARIIGHRFWASLLQQQGTPLLQQVTGLAKKLILITTKVEIFKRGLGFSLKCNGTITSWVVAVHTSSGSMSAEFGFRHVNFLTASGSVYYGSSLEYTDASEDINNLLIW